MVTALGALWSCAPARGGDPAPAAAEVASTRAAAGACEWDPSFSTQYCFEGDWWTEFSVRDPTVETLEVEVSNPPATVPLPFRTGLAEGYTKFAGGPGRQLPAGTLVRLRATQDAASGGHATTSDWFAYQTGDPRAYCPGGPCTPSCAPGSCGSNGCGGTCACAPGMTCQGGQCVAPGGCVAPWNPKWEQGPSAGEWYAEWRIFGGSLPVSVTLEVPGGGSVPLENGFGWWTGGPGGLPTGTTVYLRATDVTGATARTLPFHYLMDTAPVTDPCAGTPGTSPDCAPLKRGMVSFTMDDSLPSQDELARPLLATYGMKATIYHITNQLSSFGVLPYAQSLAAAGHEVGSHSRTHPDLASVSPAQLQDELGTSKQYLLSHVGAPAESFAT
ncbi:MAG TPA: polysaccharide deacetylase family protein, partial [Myxococcaceae bacterium]